MNSYLAEHLNHAKPTAWAQNRYFYNIIFQGDLE